MKVKVDLAGDPKLGTVLFIRQAHLSPLGSDPLSPSQQDMQVARYQFKILKLLSRLRPKDVFLENWQINYTPQQLHHSDMIIDELPLAMRKQIGAALSPQRISKPTEQQLITIAFIRSAYVYSLAYNDVSLRRTLRPEESGTIEKCNDALMRNRKLSSMGQMRHPETGELVEVQKLSFDLEHPEVVRVCSVRDKLAVREMIAHLKAHPGDRIALVYGMWHEVADDFEAAGFTPQVLSVWWLLEGIPLSPNVANY